MRFGAEDYGAKDPTLTSLGHRLSHVTEGTFEI
jgi:hypothetical protein